MNESDRQLMLQLAALVREYNPRRPCHVEAKTQALARLEKRLNRRPTVLNRIMGRV